MSGPRSKPVKDRIKANIAITDSGCWEWQGKPNHNGYGTLLVGSRTSSRHMKLAHRVSYEEFVGPIPDGLDLDHQCHNRDKSCLGGPFCKHRLCVNPGHLEPATRRQNLRRGRHAERDATACSRGHEYTNGSFRLERKSNGTYQRRCLICQRSRR